MKQANAKLDIIEKIKIEYNATGAIHIDSEDIKLNKDGKDALFKSAETLAEKLGLHRHSLQKHLYNNIYYIEPEGPLVVAISLPEQQIEMYAQMPQSMWSFKLNDRFVN
ncbi:hypothetical protein [Halodesulfovibrio spirochaetisodalis]|uniref:Uncharacterized protein n=1 Tax=Halodesulfovibrio spirochaetisodalis TaxID=1560234 RepID=A0A1B7XPQ4_9BACT|nr:hypothetical protein [Halodesulfovibrio spirochaetisodalis]OBQ57483.1 hypothetical protein SP90_00050 [Halodesulfovibrio spirochaetisodalis]